MVYSNLRMAFIYQIILSIICILGLIFFGEIMITLMAFIALRPLILPKKKIQDFTPYRQFYNQITFTAFVVTVITLISPLLLEKSDMKLLLYMILPVFLFFQGIAAIIFLKQSKIE